MASLVVVIVAENGRGNSPLQCCTATAEQNFLALGFCLIKSVLSLNIQSYSGETKKESNRQLRGQRTGNFDLATSYSFFSECGDCLLKKTVTDGLRERKLLCDGRIFSLLLLGTSLR